MSQKPDVCETARNDLCSRLSGPYARTRREYDAVVKNLNNFRDKMDSASATLKRDGCGGFGVPKRYNPEYK